MCYVLLYVNPLPGLGVTGDILWIWKLRLRKLCKALRAPQLGLDRAGMWATICLPSKPRLDHSSVFPDDGSCGEATILGKVQLCVAVAQASCVCPAPAPITSPTHSLCLSHSLLASVFPSPTRTLLVLCQLSAGTQAEAASA